LCLDIARDAALAALAKKALRVAELLPLGDSSQRCFSQPTSTARFRRAISKKAPLEPAL
jgi:hypothetical protein